MPLAAHVHLCACFSRTCLRRGSTVGLCACLRMLLLVAFVFVSGIADLLL